MIICSISTLEQSFILVLKTGGQKGSQCWVSYFLKVTCYSYKLLHEKTNLLQLLLHFKSNKLLYKLLYYVT